MAIFHCYVSSPEGIHVDHPGLTVMCAVGGPGPGASGQVSSDWAQMECKKDVVAARLRNVAMCMVYSCTYRGVVST
jgi:hypothetical protein